MAEWQVGSNQAMPARRTLGRIFGIIAVVLLAGCQAVVPRQQAPTTPAPKQPTGPVTDRGLPQDLARHRVALLIPMSGGNAGVGRSIANATTMALLDTKTERVRITTYDSAGGTASAARRAIAEGNRLILGPLTAEEVRIVAPIAHAAGVPLVSFSNDVSVAGDGVFLLGYSPTQSVERVVRFARSKGHENFAALVPRGLYGERAGNAFLHEVKASGGALVAMETFDRSPGSVAAAVKRLAASSSYDALLIADVGRIAVQAAPLVRANGGQAARLLGTELWNTDSSLSSSAALHGAWFASVSDRLYRTIASKYRTRYGAAPYRLASLGYDAVLLTVRIAQDWKAGTPFPTQRLSDPDGFSGVDGAFRFDKGGIAERALEVQRVGAGDPAIVDPAPQSLPR